MMNNTRVLMLLLLGGLAGCDKDSGTGPEDRFRTTEELTFVRAAADAPPLADSVVSFWAVRGEDREVRLYYAPDTSSGSTPEFLRFRVPSGALARYPDGTAFAPGDSVLITLRVVDPPRFIVEFAPSGLRFSSAVPAELRVRFAEAEDDLDNDGDVDARDEELKAQLSIWKQENTGDPWERIGTAVIEDLEEVEAELLGFTNYALAF